MQILYIKTMVQKFVNWSSKTSEGPFEESKATWQDFQGLSWIFFEDVTLESQDDGLKPTISYA